MKTKTLLVLLFAALLIIAPACGKKDASPAAPADAPQPAQNADEAVAPAASGPCNNILFPLSDGNNWVYEVESVDENGDPDTIEYAWSVSEPTADSVKLGTLFYESGTVLSADIECSDGMVENFPLTVSNIVIGDMEGSVEYEYISGKYLPSAAELEAGNWENEWQTVINSSGTITAEYDGEAMTIELEDSPITMNWKILEKDVSVSVPAGTFDNAIRINQEMIYDIKSLKVSAGDAPMEISTKMTFDSDYWFVPNLGLVKTEMNAASVELFGSKFPVDMTGGSELKSSNLLN